MLTGQGAVSTDKKEPRRSGVFVHFAGAAGGCDALGAGAGLICIDAAAGRSAIAFCTVK
jgi:hypothetical protein